MRSTSSFAFATLAFASLISAPARAEVKAGQPAADFDAVTFAGQPLKLSSLRGKVVLLDFWASWCEPCKKELPLLDRMAPRLRAKGIEIVAVNIDDDKSKAIDFVRTHNLHLTAVSDAQKRIVATWEPPKMPSSYVVDRKGVVRAVHGGFEPGDEAKLEAELAELVAR